MQKLIFKKRFNKLGYNTIDFIIEDQLTNMSFMFNLCSSLKKVEFISIDTSKVTNMSTMFQECNELEYLDLTNFNTSKVTNMSYMFYDCKELEYLGLTNFNTSNVTDISFMFTGCKKLKQIMGINPLSFQGFSILILNCYFN